MSKILLNNAYESWMNAIVYARLIKDGIQTLGYKKSFVSSLHNAVELFVKQIMLDKCDYRVATIKNGLSSDGQPLKNYYNSTDLNLYFGGLNQNELKRFFSIEFNQLIEICKNDKLFIFAFTPGLKLLSDLRNLETHFYIDSSSYLSDSEFLTLYNFMIDFYKELERYKLLPWNCGVIKKDKSDYADFIFDVSPITTFQYSSAIKRSDVTKLLSDYFNIYDYDGPKTDSAVVLAGIIWDGVKQFPRIYSFGRLTAYIESLFLAKAITFVESFGEIEPGGDKLPYYKVKIKTL